MRLRDQTPLDPEVEASLDAIDAVLAGEPVDPRHAELAELALMLAGERQDIDTAFATLLDEGVERRFTSPRPARRARGASPKRWLWGPAAGLALASVVAIAVVLSPGSSHPARSNSSVITTASSGASTPSPAAAAPAAKEPGDAAPSRHAAASGSLQAPARLALAKGTSFSANATTPVYAPPAVNQLVVIQPPGAGRKIIQGAQLALTTAPSHVDAVAQEVFDVVGQARGVVNHSTVTASSGPGGYAQFQLSIPSAALPQTMGALSTLQYARVSSRTDNSQDVTGQYNGDLNTLADARALRTSLLKQLAGAATQAQIDSLTAQLHDAEASISSDVATLRGLNNQINYSQVTLTINGGLIAVPSRGAGSSGFTLHQAAHDAGRVLTVAAGVALIALAALVPIALLGALAWWVISALRRRRREQALDLA